MNIFSFCYEATLVFLALKIPNEFQNILWFMPHLPNLISTDMTAIRNGFYLVARIGCSKLIIESDSSFAVDAMKAEMMKEFGQVDFLHCFREANEVANTIAKYAFSSSTSYVWDAIPDFISSSLVKYLSII